MRHRDKLGYTYIGMEVRRDITLLPYLQAPPRANQTTLLPLWHQAQKEDREKESVAYWKRVRGLHLPLLLGLPFHGQSWYDNYPHTIAPFDTIDHLFLPLVLNT